MVVYLIAFSVALSTSLLLTPITRMLAPKLGAMDEPGELSIHASPTPRTGGLAIFVGFLAAILSARSGVDDGITGILIGSGLIVALGFLDDLRRLSPGVRLLWQLLAGLVVCTGFQVQFIPLLWIALPLTLFYLVGGVNAMNFLDGMDGLASGISTIASLFLFLIFLQRGETTGATLSLALLGSSLGFLTYNLPPAKIFMGDAGSMFLGFVLATLAVMLTEKPFDIIGFVAPILVIGVPVLDTSMVIIRRCIQGRSPFAGDRSHSYDIFIKNGYGRNKTLLIFYCAGVLFGLGGLALS